jgi:hypothetical protein
VGFRQPLDIEEKGNLLISLSIVVACPRTHFWPYAQRPYAVPLFKMLGLGATFRTGSLVGEH